MSRVGASLFDFTAALVVGLYGLSALLSLTSTKTIKNSERLLFIKEFVDHPSQIGAIAPSSHALAIHITSTIPDRSRIDPQQPGWRLLEIGAGTGVFTKEIIKKLGPNDHLDVVEYGENFCKQLREEFGSNPNITVHNISITEFCSEPYDRIVSGLPLKAFSPEMVRKIHEKYEILSKQGAILSYFEYIAVGKIGSFFLSGEASQNMKEILQEKKRFTNAHEATFVDVFANLPPARVHICRM